MLGTREIALFGTGLMVALALAPEPAWTAPGDPVHLDGAVAVRVAPRDDAPVLRQLEGGVIAVERDRLGAWVEVEIPAQFLRGWIPATDLAIIPAAAKVAGEEPAQIAPAGPGPEPRAKARSGEAPAVDQSARPEPATDDQWPDLEDPGLLARLFQRDEAEGVATLQPDEPSEPAAIVRFRASVRYLDAQLEERGEVRVLDDAAWAAPGAVQVSAGPGWSDLAPEARERIASRLFDRWLAASDSPHDLRLEIRDPAGRLVITRKGPK